MRGTAEKIYNDKFYILRAFSSHWSTISNQAAVEQALLQIGNNYRAEKQNFTDFFSFASN